MMANVRSLMTLMICAFSLVVAASNEVRLDDLGWMAGHWQGTSGDVAMEEFWTEPRGGVMVGLHRDVFSARPAFFEYLRIEQRESAVVFIASPRGQGATEFVLVSIGPDEVVFENLEHDFPQRIIYRRQGDLMVARIEGDGPGETKARQWEWHLVD